ncbi:MAG: hypothetical protein JXM69_14825 [Anaerolineae bacterium]|nr:hypothetical protein [Anaerolineae bacterium]
MIISHTFIQIVGSFTLLASMVVACVGTGSPGSTPELAEALTQPAISIPTPAPPEQQVDTPTILSDPVSTKQLPADVSLPITIAIALPPSTAIPTPPPLEVPELLPDVDTTVWDLPGPSNITGMRDTILLVLRANEVEFDLGYAVQGFSPDPIYPRLFIRDTSTLMTGASYLYPAERLKRAVEAFLRQQYDETTVSSEDGWRAGFGAISATVGPDGVIDKATAVSDEEAHFVHAAYVVYQIHGGEEWLRSDINGLPVIARLNAAGDWLLNHRRNEATGLIMRDHTTDWGDVRFQPTAGNPTDIMVEDVVWTASIYDQALAYRAWRELAAMNRAVGNESTAPRWDAEAETLRHATNEYLWQPERGFYRTHVHLTPLRHNFDEAAMVSIANAVAMVCGLTDETQNARIVTALEEARLAAGVGKPGLTLYPPYPDGFFEMPTLSAGGTYQNGGVWDWWGSWQVLAEFETGYSQLARAHLLQTAADWANHPAQIFEWQEVSTLTGHGGDLYAGAAGAYAQVVIEGLYGVRLGLDGPTLDLRLGEWPGRISAYQPASGLRFRYSYQPAADYLVLVYQTNYQGTDFPLRLLLPSDFVAGLVYLDDVPLVWEQVGLGLDRYLATTLPTGYHYLVVAGSPG